tara:strand:- start:384 stop:524 length:141 start_codon:yes stop_codon:yes gene_type:complete
VVAEVEQDGLVVETLHLMNKDNKVVQVVVVALDIVLVVEVELLLED